MKAHDAISFQTVNNGLLCLGDFVTGCGATRISAARWTVHNDFSQALVIAQGMTRRKVFPDTALTRVSMEVVAKAKALQPMKLCPT